VLPSIRSGAEFSGRSGELERGELGRIGDPLFAALRLLIGGSTHEVVPKKRAHHSAARMPRGLVSPIRLHGAPAMITRRADHTVGFAFAGASKPRIFFMRGLKLDRTDVSISTTRRYADGTNSIVATRPVHRERTGPRSAPRRSQHGNCRRERKCAIDELSKNGLLKSATSGRG